MPDLPASASPRAPGIIAVFSFGKAFKFCELLPSAPRRVLIGNLSAESGLLDGSYSTGALFAEFYSTVCHHCQRSKHAAHLFFPTLHRVVDVHVHMEMYYGVFYSGAL